MRNFDARHGKIETGAVVKSRRRLSGVERGQGVCQQWPEVALKEEKVYVTGGKKKASVRRETSAVSSMRAMIVHQNRHRRPLHPLSHQ